MLRSARSRGSKNRYSYKRAKVAPPGLRWKVGMTNFRTILNSTLLSALIVLLAYAQPSASNVEGAPIPIQILAQSPAESSTDLQVICLFRSSPVNALHGSLTETNEKMNGLLEFIRKPGLFRGELGETLLIAPPQNSLTAKRLLIIGLGDSQTFTPQQMQLVGEIFYVEASRIGVAHPFFAPTILDGGIAKFTTGEIAEQVISGFLRARAIDEALRDANASASQGITALTYLAGPQNVRSTREGIDKAIAAAAGK
jgi:hypothetical protein